MSWNPRQYLRFSDERRRPALELLARVPVPDPRLVYDLGCGTGDVTRIMAEQWPAATVVGLDDSAAMLEKARADAGRIEWVEADIASWRPSATPDLIFANASLHWLADHHALFPRLVSALAPSSCLAVQMPLSWNQPSHRLMRETLEDGSELRRRLERRPVEDAAFYFELLAERAAAVDIWQTEYLHVLEGEDAVLEWVRGTGLRPVLAGLDDEPRARFLAAYRQRLREAYPPRPDGRTLYPFRRLFIVATA